VTLQLARIRQRLAQHEPLSLDGPQVEKRAAVSVILREQGEASGPEVLLMRRATSTRDPWSGHMSFPGGRHEPHDADLSATAQRETLEEVGLDLTTHGTPLGRLDDIEAVARALRTGMIIRPYVFEVPASAELRGNYEVAELVWAPLRPLFSGERNITHDYELAGRSLKLPAYDVQGRVVWGLTHQMLASFFMLLRQP
jgi:8-oxo-dGTP pyrophosphatase MutT (NUDIX family)